MSERDEIFCDAERATASSHGFDPAHDASCRAEVRGTEDGVSDVVVLDDTEPSSVALDGCLIERNRRLRETIRLLQDAMAEWVVVSDPAQEK